MTGPQIDECGKCHEKVMWASYVKKNGQRGRMLFDVAHTDDGAYRMFLGVAIADAGEIATLRAEWVHPKKRAALLKGGVNMRNPHYATCAAEADKRKPRRDTG
jgi:hypothetical protein